MIAVMATELMRTPDDPQPHLPEQDPPPTAPPSQRPATKEIWLIKRPRMRAADPR